MYVAYCFVHADAVIKEICFYVFAFFSSKITSVDSFSKKFIIIALIKQQLFYLFI